ncbi:MAG: hypothetical protein ACYTHJ_02330 [Planctomycetota bacterium]|jgi:hypothetical protein
MRLIKLIAVGFVFALGMAGCNPRNGLPATVDVELPDGTVVETTLGSGVISFADSSWQFFRTSNQNTPFVTVVFGSDGELVAFEDNTIATSIFGDTILFDGTEHPTSQAGLSYAAATFGAQTSDAQGFAFDGEVTAFAAGIQAAEATASASGEFDGDDVDTVRGTFTFSSRVTLLDIPEGNLDDEFTFIGRRVVD